MIHNDREFLLEKKSFAYKFLLLEKHMMINSCCILFNSIYPYEYTYLPLSLPYLFITSSCGLKMSNTKRTLYLMLHYNVVYLELNR